MKLRRFLGSMATRPPRRLRRCGGFTLVEILTATAIMSLIVSLVMTILTQVMSAWDRSSNDLQMSSEASSVFQLVSQDLEMAIFRTDGNQWLSLTTEVPQGCPISTANMSRLIFYTTTPLRQTKDNGTPGVSGNVIPGDISAVEYRVVYADPFGNAASTQKTLQLHRVVVDPGSTFSGVSGRPLMGIGQRNGATYTTLPQAFDGLVDSSTEAIKSRVALSQGQSLNISVYGSGTTTSLFSSASVAQFNVFLYFYGYDASSPGSAPTIQPYPQTAYRNVTPASYYYGGAPQTNGAPTPNSVSYLDTYTTGQPKPTFLALAYADITITFLTDEGVALLQSLGSMPQGFSWPQFVQQFGKTYTQRVRFYNKPR